MVRCPRTFTGFGERSGLREDRNEPATGSSVMRSTWSRRARPATVARLPVVDQPAR
ncbi:hypothetical protein AB0L30_30530 [Microbispora rosea]|uniref:hypothetical protein n=1 Tax=Microbispora rosea TaxID=58117 RepID=UPI0034237DF3